MTTATAPVEPSHNVFISWSGARSRAIATALHGWLPLVVQAARPWMSDTDIASGKRWRNELGRQLQSLRIGIICLCPENQTSTAIHFEAGALSREIGEDTRLMTYCFDLRPADLGWPLSDFQGCAATRDDTLKLVKSINAVMPTQLQDTQLETVFNSLWPQLEAKLDEVPARPATGVPAARKPDDMIVEILERVKAIERASPPRMTILDVPPLRPPPTVPDEDILAALASRVDRDRAEAFRRSLTAGPSSITESDMDEIHRRATGKMAEALGQAGRWASMPPPTEGKTESKKKKK